MTGRPVHSSGKAIASVTRRKDKWDGTFDQHVGHWKHFFLAEIDIEQCDVWPVLRENGQGLHHIRGVPNGSAVEPQLAVRHRRRAAPVAARV
jgi:hypothetical protein